MINAQQALARLREGNLRFADNRRSHDSLADEARREALQFAQSPFAIVLGCSDSRVPAEIVFDQGLGDLFVIRVAGNVVAPSQIGSVEFAVESFGTPLVVVMGHSECGAVSATLSQLQKSLDARSSNLDAIVQRIAPAVTPLLEHLHGEQLMSAAVRANIEASVDGLRRGSPFLRQQEAAGTLMIIGAEYSLAQGTVQFLESPQ